MKYSITGNDGTEVARYNNLSEVCEFLRASLPGFQVDVSHGDNPNQHLVFNDKDEEKYRINGELPDTVPPEYAAHFIGP